MKALFEKSRILALIIALAILLSFAACSAAPEMNEDFENNFSPEMSEGVLEDKDEAADAPEYDYEVGLPDAEEPGVNEKPGDEVIGDEGNEIPDDVQKPSFVENPFISTQENNTSTFSADVDTASYTYFRKMIGRGYTFEQLVNAGASFRTEEFINYFRYDVEYPGENELFGVKTELSACPWNEENLIFRLTLQAEQAVNDGGNNLVFLIDVSGSMSSDDKLPLLKKAFSYLVSNLDRDDTVSIVTYSGKEAVVLDGANGIETDEIMNAINSLKASGSTNGEAGLTMAYQIAEKHFKPEGNNRIIMASDGDLNVGISSADDLKTYIEEKRDQGVYLSVLGFGTGNYQDARMEALADNGNGVYYYIDGETEAEKVFGTDLVGTLYTVAEDVKLQLEFNSERIESYRLIGYENRKMANEDFENDKKDAGEVGASHQVTVCYEIKPITENCEADMEKPYITLRVRYKNPGEELSLLNEYTISDSVSDMSDDQRFILSVVQLCMLLHKSEYIGDATLEGVIAELDALTLTDSYKVEFRELLHSLAE